MTGENAKARLLELASRVEAASGPDRELDCLVENALGIAKFERDPRVGFGDADYNRVPPKPYTASLDAAMSLVPSWAFPLLDWRGCHCRLRNSLGLDFPDYTGLAVTPCLALLAATLRGLASQGDVE